MRIYISYADGRHFWRPAREGEVSAWIHDIPPEIIALWEGIDVLIRAREEYMIGLDNESFRRNEEEKAKAEGKE